MGKQVTNSRMRRRKRRNRRILRAFIWTGLLLFVVLGGMVGYFAWKLSDVAADTQESLERGEKSERRDVAVDPKQDNFSVLFLGVDSRDGDLKGRTDALLLGTFNKDEGSVKITSIPRDSLVYIPEHGEDKINHAHAYGGTDLAVRTVENLFDIPVDYYVKLNFEAFIEIINAFGGVEVDVPFSFTEQDSNSNDGAISIQEGTQLLNGEEALAYARMRKQDPRGDLGRGERQQQIIEALVKKSASISSITNYDDVLGSLEKHMKMNLSFGNIISLHRYAGSISEIESLQLDGKNTRLNNVYYYQVTEESKENISNQLKAHLEVHGDQNTTTSSVQGDATTENNSSSY